MNLRVLVFMALLVSAFLSEPSFADNSGDHSLAMAMAAEKNEDYKSALVHYRKVMQFAALKETGTVGVVRNLLRSSQLDEAEDILEAYLKNVNPFHLDMHVLKADLFLHQKKFAETYKMLDVADKLRAPYAPALDVRGRAHMAQLQYDKAAHAFSEYLKLTNDWEIRSKRAQCLMHLGKFDLAAADWKMLIDERPSSIDSYVGFAETQEKLNTPKEAIGRLKEASRFFPKSRELMFKLARLNEAMGNVDESIAIYKKMIEMAPSNPDYGYALSQLYFKNGKGPLAETQLNHVLRITPSYGPAAELLSHMWILEKRSDKAGLLLKDFFAKYPKQVWAAKVYAQLLVSIGQFDDAEDIIDKGLDVDEDNLDLRILKSVVERQDGSPKSSLKILLKAQTEFPTSSAVSFHLAATYQDLERMDEALPIFRSLTNDKEFGVLAQQSINKIEKRGNPPGPVEVKEAAPAVQSSSSPVTAPAPQFVVPTADREMSSIDSPASDEPEHSSLTKSHKKKNKHKSKKKD